MARSELQISSVGGQDGKMRLRWTQRFSRVPRLAIFAAPVIVFLLGLVWFLAGQLPPNPVYHGKALARWLETYDPSSPFGRGSPQWREADEAVRHIGTNALPMLLQMLRQTHAGLKIYIGRSPQRQHFFNFQLAPASTRNTEASRAFIVLGDTAKAAVPDLIKAFNENQSTESQCAIEDALTWIGPSANLALPLLLQAATNANNKVRANALWALGDIHAEPQLCVPQLIQALNDLDDQSRLSAAHALGMFGADAESAIPALMALTNFPKARSTLLLPAQVQFEAWKALKEINSQIGSPPIETFRALKFRVRIRCLLHDKSVSFRTNFFASAGRRVFECPMRMLRRLWPISFLAAVALHPLPLRADSDPAHMQKNSEKPQPWPGGIIPYDISKLNQEQQHIALRAMQRWMDTGARIKFIPRTTEVEYVNFTGKTNAGNNTSHVGFKKGARNDVNITAFWWRQMEWMPSHELGHVLGFFHEQQRWDRDQFITVHYENIKPGRAEEDYDWIPKTNWIISSLPYDYHSITHYRICWASKCEDQCKDGIGRSPCAVIEPIDKKYDGVIGQWTDNGISALDAERARLVYGVRDSPPPSATSK
jgi:hypothetical protein